MFWKKWYCCNEGPLPKSARRKTQILRTISLSIWQTVFTFPPSFIFVCPSSLPIYIYRANKFVLQNYQVSIFLLHQDSLYMYVLVFTLLPLNLIIPLYMFLSVHHFYLSYIMSLSSHQFSFNYLSDLTVPSTVFGITSLSLTIHLISNYISIKCVLLLCKHFPVHQVCH